MDALGGGWARQNVQASSGILDPSRDSRGRPPGEFVSSSSAACIPWHGGLCSRAVRSGLSGWPPRSCRRVVWPPQGDTDWVVVEIRGQRSPGCALEGSAVGLASGYTSWLFSRGRDFGPGAYLFVVLGTSTRLHAILHTRWCAGGETKMRFQSVFQHSLLVRLQNVSA